MKIFGDLNSGNCLKVKLVADYLNLSYEWVPIDITKGEAKTDEFLAINPFGQVPTIVLDDGRSLAQSNAIISFLSEGSSLIPIDHYSRAKVNEWLFWEQYSHEPYVAVCRFHMFYLKNSKETREQWRVEKGEQALNTMNEHLSQNKWLVGSTPTIADISLLAYTRVADEGGFDLSARPNVVRWIKDCEAFLREKESDVKS